MIYGQNSVDTYWNTPSDVDRAFGRAEGNRWSPGYGPDSGVVQPGMDTSPVGSSMTGKMQRFQELQSQIMSTVSRLGNVAQPSRQPASQVQPPPVTSAPGSETQTWNGWDMGNYGRSGYYGDPDMVDTRANLYKWQEEKRSRYNALMAENPDPTKWNWETQRVISGLRKEVEVEDARQGFWQQEFARNAAAVEADKKWRLENEAYAATRPNYYVTPDGRTTGGYMRDAEGGYTNKGVMPGPSRMDIEADKEAMRRAVATGKLGEPKPTNMPPWYDAMSKRMLGPDSNNPSKLREFDSWLATPEGNKEAEKFQSEYAKRNATPLYMVQPTSEGLIPFNARTGQPEQSTGFGKPLPSEMVTAQQQIGTLKETLGRVKQTYKEEYVGPVGGRWGQLSGEWIGNIPEEQAAFYADIAQINNMLVYLMSGKQINEQEYKRLTKQLPSANLPPATFNARMKTFEETLDSIISNRKQNMGGYGANTGNNRNTTAPQAAVDYLKTHPEAKDQFRAKYGYLPEGF